jgi:hypothetical protein
MPGAEVFLHKKSGLDELLFDVHNAIGHAHFWPLFGIHLKRAESGPGIRGASDEFALRPTANAFSCPHCNAIAHQDWFSLFLKLERGTDVVVLTLEAALMLVNAHDGDDNDNDKVRD